MADTNNNTSVADIRGAWGEPDWDSGLIDRCRKAWSRPRCCDSAWPLTTFCRLQRGDCKIVLTTTPRCMTESLRPPSSMPAERKRALQANPDIALRLQSTRFLSRVVEIGLVQRMHASLLH